MTTSFDKVYTAFFEKMEADENFFRYFDLTEEEAMSLARDRAHTYLKESLSVLLRKVEPTDDFSFADYDDELETFNVQLTDMEIDMIASLMYECEYRRQYSKVKALQMQHVPTTLQVFSPANERDSVVALIRVLHEENMTMIDNYSAKDRDTYKAKTIDYDSYADDDDDE